MVHSSISVIYGEYTRTLDDKYRLTVPVEWREVLGTIHMWGYRREVKFFHSRRVTPCLVIGREDIIDGAVEEYRNLPPEDQTRLEAITTLILNRELDGEGRMMIRRPELYYLKIDSAVNHPRVVLYGKLDRFIITKLDYPTSGPSNKPSPLECM